MLDLHHQINEMIIIEHQQLLAEQRRAAFHGGEPGPVRAAIGRALIHLGERIRGMECREAAPSFPRQPMASAR